MKTKETNILDLYDYAFPQELIATEPAHPRDSARLLIYDRSDDTVSLDTFSNITTYLPKDAVLVFNETRVIPARIHLKKSTGGTIGALYLGSEGEHVRMLAEGKLATGDVLEWVAGNSFTVMERDGREAVFKPSFAMKEIVPLLEQYGETPLPPYIKDSALSETQKREEYQTVFAHNKGSVAAPTAGLHFTDELLQKIKDHGCDIQYVTLHVNLGTFAPVTDEQIHAKKLHQEWYKIDEKTAAMLNEAKDQDRPIIAVGTTVVRTLESATINQRLQRLSGVTSIFLTEDDHLQFAESLITNFHVPRSSLLMLVSSLTGREKLFELYQKAIEEKFRLFSFGDGMLIL